MARLAPVLVVVAAALAVFGVPPAHAYDASNCGTDVPWEDIDPFKVQGGIVDFGDELHLGGAPQGTAVVCWDGNPANANARRVRLVGKLYRDGAGQGPGVDHCAIAQIAFVNAAGNTRASARRSVGCAVSGLRWREIFIVVAVPVRQVRIQLFSHQMCCEQPQLRRTKTVSFGD